MRNLRLLIMFLSTLAMTIAEGSKAWAVEEGQLVRTDGRRWEYVSSEDPGLKYLLLKGIITQEEYERGLVRPRNLKIFLRSGEE
ncbi:MAG: hypothetical protein ACREI2_05120 [Nitrospiraceae bacterium]